jgi:hypothetical protein
MSNKEIEPYYQSGEAGVEHRSIDAAGSDHPFGDEPKEWEADLRPLIRQVADDLYESWEATVREYLANAETACLKVKRHSQNPEDSPFESMIGVDNYEARIVVQWDKAEQKLIIQDNGIGMAAVEVDEVFRHIGRSAARDLGTMSGAFGMGALSFPKFIGPENTMVMMSHSRLNDDNAAYLVTLAGVEPVRGSLDSEEYGTRFSLDQKEQDMAVRDAVRRFSEWMRVPVLYTEKDENGEEIFNEDWGDKHLYDDYDQGKYVDSFVVPGCFEAYMCSQAEGRTLLLSMEIDRGIDKTYDAPYPFDVRILDESGKVVESSNGHEGLMPIARMEYEQMLLDARPEFITDSLLSNQDVAVQSALKNGDEVYVVEQERLHSDEVLPMGNYVTPDAEVDSYGPKNVILGPHKGRVVVSQDEWEKLPEGRASQFVPEDELEPYDLDTGEGDLCLPKPTTDRSSLQSNETFWKYISGRFAGRYDDSINEWLDELNGVDDEEAAIRQMTPRTVSDVKNAQ